MSVIPMTPYDVATCDDVDLLWSAFLDARDRSDTELADAIRQRMAQLQEQRHLADLDDDQLLALIANRQQRETAGRVDGAGEIDLVAMPPSVSAELTALLREADRRGL